MMDSHPWLRRFSKITCLSTLILIFVGGMVTSTGSGLSVPDWPLSYGTFFPPMVGGVFYEHGHRVVASTVGFLTLILTIWLWHEEKRIWVRNLGFAALAAVILQGILGGITVLFFLPAPVSIGHAFLAQTFFLLTIIIAYSLSLERKSRENKQEIVNQALLKTTFILIITIYIQLILGAIMRHAKSGLAIPDFPKMGGYWWPPFNQEMLNHINHWRYEHDLNDVTMPQVIFHFLHRLSALIIFIVVCVLNAVGLKFDRDSIRKNIIWLDFIIIVQITL